MNVARPMPQPDRMPHRLAVVLACATFPLIWVGGLVTTYDAGMAVPDWPSTFGYNLFAYPWQTWLWGPWDLFIEHGHRLLGAFVGMVTIAFVVSVFRSDRRLWMRVAAIAALVGVVAQGALGGMRVLLDDRQLAMMHGCFGPAFFAFTFALVAFTSRSWRTLDDSAATSDLKNPNKLHRLAILMPLIAYVQLVLGATLRHLPIDVPPSYFQTMVVFHLLFAAAVAAHAAMLAVEVRRRRLPGVVATPAWMLCGLVAVQIGLGVATWVVKYNWPAWFDNYVWTAGAVVREKTIGQAVTVTAHVATGSLILATSVLIGVRAFRVCNPWAAEGESPSQVPDVDSGVHRYMAEGAR